VCAVRRNDALQPVRYFLERGVPGDGLESPRSLGAHAPQGLAQPALRVAPFPVVGGGALSAEGTAADGVSRIAADRRDPSVAPMHQHSAGIVAIPRAGGEYYIVVRIARCHGVADSSAFLIKSARICDASSRSGAPRNCPISAAVKG